jgi:hypothetical protein
VVEALMLHDSRSVTSEWDRWRWALACVCAIGLLGFGAAIWTALNPSASTVNHLLSVQAVYISSVAVLLWRVRTAMGQCFRRAFAGALPAVVTQHF